jgi:DNA invertase Pin-like site-specific DNA recombinase
MGARVGRRLIPDIQRDMRPAHGDDSVAKIRIRDRKSGMSAIVYVRASAECRTSIEEQVECLQDVAGERGWTVARIITDRPMPLKRAREQRPGETALLNAIRARGVDKVLLFSLDRIGRSLAELVTFLETCRANDIALYVHDRGIDTATCNGLPLFDFGSMMAHHLRQGRRDRILRGQAAARNASVRFGRPPIAVAKVDKVRTMLRTGRGVRETARLIAGISPASVSLIKSSMNAEVASRRPCCS